MPRENTLDKRLPRIRNLKRGRSRSIAVPAGHGAAFGGSPLRADDAQAPLALPLNLSCESLVLEASDLALKKFHPALGLARLGRPAGGHRSPDPRARTGGPFPDPDGRYGQRQDLHDGQRRRRGQPTHAGAGPQQDAGGAALQRVQDVLSGERRALLRQLL